MYHDRLTVVKQLQSLADAPARIKQQVTLIRQTYVQTKVLMLLKESLDLGCKVVYLSYL